MSIYLPDGTFDADGNFTLDSNNTDYNNNQNSAYWNNVQFVVLSETGNQWLSTNGTLKNIPEPDISNDIISPSVEDIQPVEVADSTLPTTTGIDLTKTNLLSVLQNNAEHIGSIITKQNEIQRQSLTSQNYNNDLLVASIQLQSDTNTILAKVLTELSLSNQLKQTEINNQKAKNDLDIDFKTAEFIQNYERNEAIKNQSLNPTVNNSITVPENAINITQSTPTVNNSITVPDSAISVSVTQDSPTVNVTNTIDTTDITTAVNTMKDTNASIDSHLSDIKTSTLTYHTKANTKNEALTDELTFNKNGVDTLKDTEGNIIKPREAKAVHNAEKAIETKDMNGLEILEDDIKSLLSEGAEFLQGITTDGFTDDFGDGMNPLNFLFEQVKKAKAKEYKVMQDDGVSLAQMKQNLDSLNT